MKMYGMSLVSPCFFMIGLSKYTWYITSKPKILSCKLCLFDLHLQWGGCVVFLKKFVYRTWRFNLRNICIGLVGFLKCEDCLFIWFALIFPSPSIAFMKMPERVIFLVYTQSILVISYWMVPFTVYPDKRNWYRNINQIHTILDMLRVSSADKWFLINNILRPYLHFILVSVEGFHHTHNLAFIRSNIARIAGLLSYCSIINQKAFFIYFKFPEWTKQPIGPSGVRAPAEPT
jgi:hypothetical protein